MTAVGGFHLGVMEMSVDGGESCMKLSICHLAKGLSVSYMQILSEPHP